MKKKEMCPAAAAWGFRFDYLLLAHFLVRFPGGRKRLVLKRADMSIYPAITP